MLALASMGSAQCGHSISSRGGVGAVGADLAMLAGMSAAALHVGQTFGFPDLRHIE